MARKNVLDTEIILGKSLATSFISPVTAVTYLDNISYQINITTTNSIGTFKVQASNDYEIVAPNETVVNPGNWVDLTLSGSVANPVANAANDQIIINLHQLPFNAVRLVYTSGTAGTGTCNIYMTSKQVGG